MKFEDARYGDGRITLNNNQSQAASKPSSPVKVLIMGVGGGGSNAVDNMIRSGVKYVDMFMSVNTDVQALRASKAFKRVQIGANITKGFGAGANPDVGRAAAEEAKETLTEMMRDMDLVFITAGMGGGTGTGAAPIVAEIAHNLGKLTVAFVTKPFAFEGEARARNAEIGIANLRKNVDAIIIVQNERLTSIAKDMTMQNAFKYADDVLRQGVLATTDLIANPGRINVDFADIQTVLRQGGDSFMGIGRASGSNRALEAVKKAVNNAVLDMDIRGASRAIINIEGKDVKVDEANLIVSNIKEICAKDVNIIFGTSFVENLQDEIQVTVIATGFNKGGAHQPAQQQFVSGINAQGQYSGSVGFDRPVNNNAFANNNVEQQPRYDNRPPVQQPSERQPRRNGNGFVSLDDDAELSWQQKLQKLHRR